MFVDFEVARGYAIEREAYVSDLKNGCKGGSDRFYVAGGEKVNWRLIKAEQKASAKRDAPPRRDEEAAGKKKKKKNQRNVDPTRYSFRSHDGDPSGQFGRFLDGYDSRPVAGSWRDEQRALQNPHNPYNQRIPHPPHFHPRGPPPQHFPPQPFHTRGGPNFPHQPFHTRGPNLFSPQYQNIPRQCFFPRFQNAPDRQPPAVAPGKPPLLETSLTTATSGGVCKIYSPQDRFPAPSTCNPRPGGGPQEQVRLFGAERKRWFRQQAATKQKQKAQESVVQ